MSDSGMREPGAGDGRENSPPASEPARDQAAVVQRSGRGLSEAFVLLVASLIAIHACMAVTRVSGTLWVLRHGYGEMTVGVLMSLFALAPLGLSMWAGRLADRWGLHRPLAIGVGLAFVGAALTLVWQSLFTIAAGAFLTGGALSMAAVAIQREVGTLASDADALKRAFSWMALGPALSNAIAPVFAGLLIDHAGFPWAFALATALPIMAWMLVARLPRQTPASGENKPPARPAWELMREPAIRNLLILNIVLSASWDAHSFVVPVIGHARGMSASSIGLVLGAFALAATAVRLIIVRWAHRMDEMQMLRGAMLLATAVLAAYAWLPGTWGLMMGSALLGLALGSVQPMILTTLHQVTPSHRHGQALGLRMLASNGGTLAMPLAFGAVATSTAVAAPLWLMAGLLGAAQWFAASLQRRTREIRELS
jgi:predicted MFS family arabinose efflux permease